MFEREEDALPWYCIVTPLVSICILSIYLRQNHMDSFRFVLVSLLHRRFAEMTSMSLEAIFLSKKLKGFKAWIGSECVTMLDCTSMMETHIGLPHGARLHYHDSSSSFPGAPLMLLRDTLLMVAYTLMPLIRWGLAFPGWERIIRMSVFKDDYFDSTLALARYPLRLSRDASLRSRDSFTTLQPW